MLGLVYGTSLLGSDECCVSDARVPLAPRTPSVRPSVRRSPAIIGRERDVFVAPVMIPPVAARAATGAAPQLVRSSPHEALREHVLMMTDGSACVRVIDDGAPGPRCALTSHITGGQHATLVGWLIELKNVFGFSVVTLDATLSLIYRSLAGAPISVETIQLRAIACLSMVSKIFDPSVILWRHTTHLQLSVHTPGAIVGEMFRVGESVGWRILSMTVARCFCLLTAALVDAADMQIVYERYMIIFTGVVMLDQWYLTRRGVDVAVVMLVSVLGGKARDSLRPFLTYFGEYFDVNNLQVIQHRLISQSMKIGQRAGRDAATGVAAVAASPVAHAADRSAAADAGGRGAAEQAAAEQPDAERYNML